MNRSDAMKFSKNVSQQYFLSRLLAFYLKEQTNEYIFAIYIIRIFDLNACKCRLTKQGR